MSKGWGMVGCTAWVDNPASIFHGLRGEVVEIDDDFARVKLKAGQKVREVWFQGWELREDRYVACRRKSVLKLALIEDGTP